MTQAEYIALLANCNFRDESAVSALATATHTNVMFNERVEERLVKNPLGAYNYFGGLFGKEVWPDGIGMDMINEYYVDPHIPFSFSYFIRQMEICDPNTANECLKDRCLVPEGGRGTMPPIQWYKWGFKTPRDCIGNIRHIRKFQYWAQKIIRGRELMDEQVMNMFFTMAGLKTAGHKIVLQGSRDAAGNLSLIPSNSPRNPLRGGLYNFMEEKFPQIINLNDVVALTVDDLRPMATYWGQNDSGNATIGPRGERIYELWTGDDWIQQEMLRDPDRIEKLKLTMPNSLFPGWTLNPGAREVVENWAPKVMPWLPRFAPTFDGKIVAVDNKVGVDIEMGQEFVPSLDFENAPFGVAVVASGRQGTILTKPPLTQSGAGFPIEPITSSGPWKIWNDYDAQCNPEKNMPYSTKDYEMGLRMDDPNAGLAILHRRRVFRARPHNECDFAPIFQVPDPEVGCAFTTVGCQTGKRREDNSITGTNNFREVSCTSRSCGNTGAAPFAFILKVERRSHQPDFNSLDCACGSTVKLFVYDAEGVFLREQLGTVKNASQGFPEAKYFVETATNLAATECIRGIACSDDTPLQGNVIEAFQGQGVDADQVIVILDSSIICDVGDDVQVRYYNAAGAVIATYAAIIEAFDETNYRYVLTSANPAMTAEGPVGTASIGVSCNEAPNVSSSSSGD